MSKADKLNVLKSKWKIFVKHEWANANDDDVEHIIRSWKKCLKKCDPYKWIPPVKASGHTWKILEQNNQEFIRVSQRVIEDYYQLNPNKNIAVYLVDVNGWTLYVVGGSSFTDELNFLGFGLRMSWNEDRIGTNAWSVCAETHRFTVLTGAEHFCEALHAYSMSASPVIDPFGEVHGFIVCVEEALIDTYSLSISHACANEIANIIYIERELTNTNKVLCQHNAVIECMDDGFICWDREMNITMINSQAEILLLTNKDQLIGRNIKDEFTFPPLLLKSIEERVKLSQKQIVLECKGKFIELMTTLRPLSDGSFLLFLHPLDKIRKIAWQQLSSNANFTFDSLHAISKNMKYVVMGARRALKTASPILIYGEEGVGKLSLAMAVHNESNYSDGPFISINCQMLSSENMVQELLGSDEGPIPSRFELAHNGTLYLEKIEYLSAELQSALLKVLKTGLVMRSQSQRLIPVKFRLVACSGSSLKDYVQRGAFSRQLFYEISINEIDIPPLHKRKEDLSAMINDALEKYSARVGKKLSISPRASTVLHEYCWPGNISEFKNRMEKILLNCNQVIVQLGDIPAEMRMVPQTKGEDGAKLLSLEEVEIQTIENACKACDWNLSKVATVLKIGRTTLWRKIKTYNLVPKSGEIK
ncbi:PTS-dependent dihydroxyacetone kinase operon transcriptional regulator DhaR [Citrobacter sp. NCU1]|uniref:dihydroxyacetone kinase operon transcriptional regulator DhaR n=1 Tax=Citrobacter sp. NCU1 TaxID=2026683 RepID=UPI00139102CF|nr:dihydroxyacetone kinase operon transcriptional regulator DhaR [Citrobacter sp. NCU1]NDO79639.1 PTS-dependent dihydroxyacetone kinase operon transcriptional regulator DhaR [Citrobacter sp. NCU1]